MSDADLAARFKAKANYIKSWKPASAPSNRDRLELYALHKQAVSGDAPGSIPSSATAPEKSKFQAWRAKSGISQEEAMRLYLQECERQVRVYGTATQTPQNTPALAASGMDTNGYSNGSSSMAPRGLAAIPLLCAAASESRQAYLRRLANTMLENAWWSRQEPLCTSPGSLWSLPEATIIAVAGLVERLSLTLFGGPNGNPMMRKALQSFMWPLHNCLLSLWMGIILVYTVLGAALEFLQTIFWGARRTGLSLEFIWNEKVQLSADSVMTMCEAHQPLSARLVGLALLPYTALVAFVSAAYGAAGGSLLVAAGLYIFVMTIITWWYWLVTLPWLAGLFLGAAFLSGNCFAVIELGGLQNE